MANGNGTITSESYLAYVKGLGVNLDKCKNEDYTNARPKDFAGNEIKKGGWVAFPTFKPRTGNNVIMLSLRYVANIHRDQVYILDKNGRRKVKVPGYKLVYLGKNFPNLPSDEEVAMYIEEMNEDLKKLENETLEEFDNE